MSVNKLISEVCNLQVPLKAKDVPSYSMLKKVFLHMQSKIKNSKTGAFRFKENEIQVLLLALKKAAEHRYLELEIDRLSELEGKAHEARRALAKHGRTDKGYREMAKIIGAPRKGRDWSEVSSDFHALKGRDDAKTILIYLALKHEFASLSPLILGLRRCGIKNLPTHDSVFAQKPLSKHKFIKCTRLAKYPPTI
jgi:hypothetical protein